MKKTFLGVALVAGFLLLAGCGTKSPAPQNSSQPSAAEEPMVPAEKMPEATGSVDGTVDAIISGADSEMNQALSDESEAQSVVDDSQDLNNLTNTYDQNEL